MALSFKNPEVERVARELAKVTGESMTEAISKALKQRLEKETGRKQSATISDEVRRMLSRVAWLRRKNHRSDDELIGYDKHGIPE